MGSDPCDRGSARVRGRRRHGPPRSSGDLRIDGRVAAASSRPGFLPDFTVSRAVELRRSKLRIEVREKRPAEDHVGIVVLCGAGQQPGEASLEGVPDLRGLEEAEHRSQCSRTLRAHRIREAQDVFAEHSDDAAVVAESQATLHQGDREGDRCQRQPGVLENLRHGGEIFTTADRRAGGRSVPDVRNAFCYGRASSRVSKPRSSTCAPSSSRRARRRSIATARRCTSRAT